MKGEQMMNTKLWVLLLLALFVLFGPGLILGSQTKTAQDIERIGPEVTYEKVKAGNAMLVCAYDDGKCADMLLEGALLRGEFESRLPTFAKDQEIVFYCA